MISSGSIGMPLHFGKVPNFLTERMGNMGNAIIESIIYNYGKSEVLTRMSDPNWFQALGAVMGMHWNSSGVTVISNFLTKLFPESFQYIGTLSHICTAKKGMSSLRSEFRAVNGKGDSNGPLSKSDIDGFIEFLASYESDEYS